MRRPGIALLALALLAVVFATTPAEQANAQTPQTFVANLGQADAASAALSNDYAQAFTTGSNSAGYSLRSVDVEFSVITSGFSSSNLTARIHTDSGGSPGSSLGTLTNPASFPLSSSDQTLTFTSAGIDLAANTTYFLVIDMSANEAQVGLRATNSDSEDSGALAGWSIGDGTLRRGFASTGTWTTNTPSLKLGLGGVSNTPRPATTTLVSSTGQSQSVFNGLTHDHAQAFTTGSAANGYTVTGADVVFTRISDANIGSHLSVTINSDSSGEPGAVLGTLTNPAFQTSTTPRTYSFTHAGLDLDADTTYWLRVNGSSSLSGTNYISVTSSNAEDAGAAPGWSIADQTLENAIGHWRVLAQNAKLRFGIKGFATPAPSLVSNFGQTDGNAGSLSTDDHAQAFTTGSHARGYILAAIDLRLAQVSDAALGSKLRVTVNADSGGGPGVVVGTLTTPTITTSTTEQTYSFTHSGLPLGSNTTYWVVVDVHGSAPTGTNTIRNTNSDAEDAGAASGWSIANDKRYRTWNSTGAWNTSSTPSIKIDIRGLDAPPDAPPVPPPPDPALVGNLAQPKGTTISLAANRNDAQAFTTGRNPGGYTVTSVDIEFAQVDWADLETAIVVTVNADSGGEPGAVVGTLTNPAFQTSTTARTYSFTHAGLELDGATTYWLVVGSVSTVQNTNRIRYTLSDSEDVSVDGWSVANTKLDRLGGGSWISRNYAMLVQIRGTRIPPLVSNFGQANGGTGSLVAHDHAQAFTTGSNVRGYDLTAIDLQFPAVGDSALASKLTVTVNEDSGGAPGAVVDTLTNPGTMTTGANSFTHAGLRLERGTTYWVVLDVTSAPSGTNTIRNTASDAEDAGAAPGFSIADDAQWRNRGGGSWTTFGLSRKINIRGTAVEGDPPGRLVSNLGEAAATSVGLGNDFAQAFTTGPNAGGYEVTGVDLRFDTVAAGLGEHLVVHVRRDGGGSPGTRVGTLTEPAFTASAVPTKYTFTHSGLRLEPDTTYWVTVDQDASTVATGSRLSTTASDAENAGGAAGFSIANVASWKPDATFTWSSVRDLSGGRSLYLGLTGAALPAEPGVPAKLSNLEMPDGGAHNLTSDRAVSFTTGNNGDHHALESVEIEFAQVSDSAIGSKLEVAILGDSSGAPNWGDRLAMLTNPTFQTGSADRTYTFSYDGDDGAGLRLAPDTTYWVAAFNSNRDLSGTNSIRGTTSASERLQGLPVGWGIANDSREWSRSTSSWNTQAEPLKIGLNLGAADPFVQFRTCEGTVSGNSCSTGWVTANYTKYDPPPTIKLMEGGAAVTYQWRAVDPRERRHHYVAGQVVEPRSTFGGYIGAGGPDRDRLICHTGMDTTRIGDPIVYVPPQTMVVGIGYGSTAGPLLDRHDGCPFVTQSIYEHDPNKWRPVSVAAGQDSDAFDHTTFLILEPYSVGHWFHNDEGEAEYAAGFGYPEARLPLIIRDDDEWENDIVISVDNGTTWTSIEDGGLDLAFPRSLNNGFGGQNYAHRFWVRLKNDPSTITGAPASKRFSVIAHAPPSPISSGTQAEFEAYYVCLRSPAADELHTFNPDTCSGGGSAKVSYTPIQVEIHVGVSVTGSIRFEVEGYHLYERWDTQISTETPKKRVRTKSFNFDRTLGSCVGCQLLPGELPDPVVERVGDLTYANLSDTGIDLSWPRVVGAEGYEVRYWSTTSPFPGVSPEEAWFGAEPSDPAWNIRHLEPETEYRAVVYYQDHGATQLSTASPVIRFTTLAAGAPVEAEPTSVIVERVPEVSITADAGRITEGEDATFTVTVEPAPDAPLDVKVHVVAPAAGDVVNRQHLGTRTVNVSTTGSATFTIPTVDDASWDANGMLGATVDFGDGYRRSAFGSFASVNIRNNDLPPPPAVQLKGISDTTMTVAWKPQGDGASYLVVWHKAYSGIPVLSEVTTTETEYEITGLEPGSYYTLSVLHGTNQLRTMTVRTLAAGATPKTFEVDFETPAPNTSVPVISVTSDGDVTEGADASFTVTANPAPDADLDVSVTVSAEGDYGAATGQRTVTIPTAGYVALTVATTGDDVDETSGSVTVTVDPDADHDDYLVSTTQGAATVAVADDDDPAGADYTDYQTVVDILIEVRDNPPNPAMRNNPAHVKKWNRVLAAVGYDSGESAMPASEVHDNAAQWPDSPFHAASVYLTSLEQPRGQGQQQTPEISVTGGAGITEGGDAVFTVTASPAPAANLDVSVTVSQSGDYGATTGQRTVTVSTSGIVSFAVGTADDSADEADGSVTATVDAGSDYTVSSSQGAATVAVSDDDPQGPDHTDYQTVVDILLEVRDNPPNPAMRNNPAHVKKWNRVLAAVGYDSGESAMPASEIHDNAAQWPDSPFKAASDYLRSQENQGQQQTPEVSVTGGSGVTEGGSATFTVTASPAPSSNLDVSVTVSQSGDYGATTGQRTVTIPTSGSVTLTVCTTDDTTDETDGSVTATVNAGSDYTVSSSQGAATVSVSDNDDAPTPEVSVTGGSGVTEGGSATFTVTASPAPSSNLDVSVTVSQSGDYGATTGQRTVTIPTSGSVTLTVGTTDDTTDETDGSVTATVNAGSDYTVSSTQGAATVAVSDNDDAPTPVVEEPDEAVLAHCGDSRPTVLINNPTASRSDATVEFEASLDCKPSGSVTLLLSVLRNGEISSDPVTYAALDGEETSITVTVEIGDSQELGLTLAWSSGVKNRTETTGNVEFTD